MDRGWRGTVIVESKAASLNESCGSEAFGGSTWGAGGHTQRRRRLWVSDAELHNNKPLLQLAFHATRLPSICIRACELHLFLHAAREEALRPPGIRHELRKVKAVSFLFFVLFFIIFNVMMRFEGVRYNLWWAPVWQFRAVTLEKCDSAPQCEFVYSPNARLCCQAADCTRILGECVNCIDRRGGAQAEKWVVLWHCWSVCIIRAGWWFLSDVFSDSGNMRGWHPANRRVVSLHFLQHWLIIRWLLLPHHVKQHRVACFVFNPILAFDNVHVCCLKCPLFFF